MAKKRAIDYSAQMLLNSRKEIETTLYSVEQLAIGVSKTLEAYHHNDNNCKLDTAYFFPLLEEIRSHSPFILGCGVFFEPYTYNRTNRVCGIYVNENPENGEMEIEWDDDVTYAEDNWDYFDTEWYKGPKETGETQWIPPFVEYMVTTEYRYMTTYSVPLKDKNGKFFGVCSFDILLDWLKDELLSMRPYPSSEVVILDENGDYLCNPNSDKPYEGNIYESETLQGKGYSGNILSSLDWTDCGKVKFIENPAKRLSCVAGELSNGWVMVIINYDNEVYEEVSRIWIMLALIAVLGLVVLFFLSRKIIRDEARPLVEFAEAAGKITGGRFDVPIPEVKNEDEIGELGNALRFMQTSVTKYIEELMKTTSEKERLAGELDVARNIQKKMLRTSFTSIDGKRVFATSMPARQVGGDMYDFALKDDYLYFIVADVSGKGVPAALLMSISISAFRAAVRTDHTMDEIVEIVNRVFYSCNDDEMFITMVAGRINVKTGKMDVCNAGHNPMVLIKSNGEASFMRLKPNLACGLVSDFDYELETLTLERGSRLLIYTDGVTEAEDVAHSQFGEDRLLDFAGTHGTKRIQDDEQVVAELISAVNDFVNGAEQFDDITVMSISI